MALQSVSHDVFRFTSSRVSQARARLSIIWAGERLVALPGFVLALPLLLAAGIAVTLLSRRSPLVSHLRLGLGGRELRVLKLRTMWGDARGDDGAPWTWKLVEQIATQTLPDPKASVDYRITSGFARILRRYSIDELPQLWQVVRGEMALIGPRPVTLAEMRSYYGNQAGVVLSVKPGLTGLWQVRGRSRLNYRQRRRLDVFLVRRWSLRLYLFIVITTVPKVLVGRDAW